MLHFRAGQPGLTHVFQHPKITTDDGNGPTLQLIFFYHCFPLNKTELGEPRESRGVLVFDEFVGPEGAFAQIDVHVLADCLVNALHLIQCFLRELTSGAHRGQQALE